MPKSVESVGKKQRRIERLVQKSMNRWALALWATMLVAGAVEYTVESESDFYPIYSKTKPGDTVFVDCNIQMGLTLAHGSSTSEPIKVVGKTKKNINGKVLITAKNLIFGGFYVSADLTVNSTKVTVTDLNMKGNLVLSGSHVTATNLILKGDLVMSGSRVTATDLDVSEGDFTIDGTHITLQNSSFQYQDHPSNQIKGSFHTVQNITIEDWTRQDVESTPAVWVEAKSLLLTNCKYEQIFYSSNRARFVFEKDGSSKNTYAQNKCEWKNDGYKPVMFFIQNDPGNDKVCASNVANAGDRTNIKVNYNC